MRFGRTGAVAAGLIVVAAGLSSQSTTTSGQTAVVPAHASTATPIQHLVVIFQENISFDHYFGTYPIATNPAGEPSFTAAPGTPRVNGLMSAGLLTNNPNEGNPQRLDRSEELTCDQNHDYTPEQLSVDHGAMDTFVQNTGSGPTRAQCDAAKGTPVPPQGTSPNDYAVLDYYDGNTVTALWNYAQHYAMSDNSYSTTYGPSTPGALNVIAGQTYGIICSQNASTFATAGGDPNVTPGTVPSCPGGKATATGGSTDLGSALGPGTMISDADQYYDVCSNAKSTAAMGGRNVGNLLDDSSLTWGWFEGGFQNQGYVPGQPGTSTVATAGCTSRHYTIGAGSLDGQPCVTHSPSQPLDKYCQADYSAHHEPFQYYGSTSNPLHTAPSSVSQIGSGADGANHQYDLADFWASVNSGHMPAVSYLKAARFQDGHPSNSDPLDEQHFLVDTINKLQQTPQWSSTAVVIAYDDSDGWYDHVVPPIAMQSQTQTTTTPGQMAVDQLTADGQCGSNPAHVPTTNGGTPEEARCGYGPRQPLLVISPWARSNYVDHQITDQSSVVRFIEDNWGLGRLGDGSSDAMAGTLDGMFDFNPQRSGDGNTLILDPTTGKPTDQ